MQFIYGAIVKGTVRVACRSAGRDKDTRVVTESKYYKQSRCEDLTSVNNSVPFVSSWNLEVCVGG